MLSRQTLESGLRSAAGTRRLTDHIPQALCKAFEYHMQSRQPRIAPIFRATAGIIFLGTPHRGSDKAAWARLVTKLAAAIGHDRNDRVIAALSRGSEILERLQDSFNGLLHHITVYSFFEALAVKGAGKACIFYPVIISPLSNLS